MPEHSTLPNGSLAVIWRDLGHRFQNPELIGHGTCAYVFSAFDVQFNRRVALKIAKTREPGNDTASSDVQSGETNLEDHSKRTRVEGELLRFFHHPNIIECHDVIECHDENTNQHYVVLVLEIADVGELYQYLSTRNTLLNLAEARYFFKQIVDAVSYCHDRAIVHRDLKLENILLSQSTRGESAMVKLADFGLAERFDPSGKRLLATYCGSLLYASPELMQNRPYRGPEVDCWALGVILFSLVCGRMPFRTNDPAATTHMANLSVFEHAMLTSKIVHAEYELPDNVRMNRPLADLICGLLCPDLNRRYSCKQIANHVWMTDVWPTQLQAPQYVPEQSNGGRMNVFLREQRQPAHTPLLVAGVHSNVPPKRVHIEPPFVEATNGVVQPTAYAHPIPGGAPNRPAQPDLSTLVNRQTPTAAQLSARTPELQRRLAAGLQQPLASSFASPRPASSRDGDRRKTATGFDENTQREIDALLNKGADAQSSAMLRSKNAFAVSAVDLMALTDIDGNTDGWLPADLKRRSTPAAVTPAPSRQNALDFTIAARSTPHVGLMKNVREVQSPDVSATNHIATMPRTRRRAGAANDMQAHARAAALLSSEAERITQMINTIGTASSHADVAKVQEDQMNDPSSFAVAEKHIPAGNDIVSLSEMLPLSISAFRERFGQSGMRGNDVGNNLQHDVNEGNPQQTASDDQKMLMAQFGSNNRAEMAEPMGYGAATARMANIRMVQGTPLTQGDAFVAPIHKPVPEFAYQPQTAPNNYLSVTKVGQEPLLSLGEMNTFIPGVYQPSGFAYVPVSTAANAKPAFSYPSQSDAPVGGMRTINNFARKATPYGPVELASPAPVTIAAYTYEPNASSGRNGGNGGVPAQSMRSVSRPHSPRRMQLNAPGAQLDMNGFVVGGEVRSADSYDKRLVVEPRWKAADSQQRVIPTVNNRIIPPARVPAPDNSLRMQDTINRPAVPASAPIFGLRLNAPNAVTGVRPGTRQLIPAAAAAPFAPKQLTGWSNGASAPNNRPNAANYARFTASPAAMPQQNTVNAKMTNPASGGNLRQPRALGVRRNTQGLRYNPPSNAQSMHNLARISKAPRPQSIELEFLMRRDANARLAYGTRPSAPVVNAGNNSNNNRMHDVMSGNAGDGMRDLLQQHQSMPTAATQSHATFGFGGNNGLARNDRAIDFGELTRPKSAGLFEGGDLSNGSDEEDVPPIVFGGRVMQL